MFAALALPPLYALPVLLVAFPGLLALIDAAPGPAVAARRGWWFGFGLHLVGLYWITEAILVEAARFWWFVPIAVPALAATLAVFIAAAAWAARFARAGWPRALALAGAWVLADLARQFVGTGFPWNLLGSVWEFPGRLGRRVHPAGGLGQRARPDTRHRPAGADARRWAGAGVPPASALLAAWAAFGIVPSADSRCRRRPDLNVVLVQGNVAEGQKWDRALVDSIFERYLRLTRGRHERAAAADRRWWSGRKPRRRSCWRQDALARRYISEATKGGPGTDRRVALRP